MSIDLLRPIYKMAAWATARRVLIGVGLEQISVQVLAGWGQARVVGRHVTDIPQTEGSVPAWVQALDRLLSRKKISGISCWVILPDDGVRWVVLPWLDTAISPSERDALAQSRLKALYGDMTHWICMTGSARFGQAQLVAALPRAGFEALRQVLGRHQLTLRSCQPAHVAAWNRWRGWNAQTGSSATTAPDLVFATLDSSSLTLSWVRQDTQYPQYPRNSLSGIRSVRLEGTEAFAIAQLKREILLQRLNAPLGCLVTLKPFGQAHERLNAWRILDASDAGRRSVAEARTELFRRTSSRPHWPAKSLRRQTSELDIDFARHRVRPSVWPRWAAWAGVASALSVSAFLIQLDHQLTALQTALGPPGSAPVQKVQAPAMSEAQKAEVGKVQTYIAGLNRPWDRLFSAIEASTNSKLTLLEINPDAQSGELHLTGDARTYKAILDFVRALNSQNQPRRDIGDAYLASYQVNEQDPQRTVHFEVNARWYPQDRDNPPGQVP